MQEEDLVVKIKDVENTVLTRARFPRQFRRYWRDTSMQRNQTGNGLRTSPDLPFLRRSLPVFDFGLLLWYAAWMDNWHKPDTNLVDSMLDQSVSSLREVEHPIVNSDRGCHY